MRNVTFHLVYNIFQILFILVFLPLLFIFTAESIAQEYDIRFDEQTKLKKDTELSGTVYVKERLSVPKGVTLTIMPGTIIRFENPGLCDDGNVDHSIMVEGDIIAAGTREKPIIFTSVSNKEMSAFGEIYITESQNSLIENCRFRYSHWALHIHDSDITVKGCEFKDSFGGIRFKGDKITITGNEFINNDTSLRFWQANPKITKNKFKDVNTAIFIREKAKDPLIAENTFKGVKDYFIKLGELQQKDITVLDNDFGTVSTNEIDEKIFDKKHDEYLGKVLIK
jgi:hypothetical protein